MTDIVPTKEQQLVRAKKLADQIWLIENTIEEAQENVKKRKVKLLNLMRRTGQHTLMLGEQYGFQRIQKPRTVIKNDMAAKKWGLESPETRMMVQVAEVTEALKHGKLKFASRVHTEELHRIRPRAKKLEYNEEEK